MLLSVLLLLLPLRQLHCCRSLLLALSLQLKVLCIGQLGAAAVASSIIGAAMLDHHSHADLWLRRGCWRGRCLLQDWRRWEQRPPCRRAAHRCWNGGLGWGGAHQAIFALQVCQEAGEVVRSIVGQRL